MDDMYPKVQNILVNISRGPFELWPARVRAQFPRFSVDWQQRCRAPQGHSF